MIHLVYISGAIAALIAAVIGAVVGGLVGYLGKRRVMEQAENDLLICMSRAQLYSHYREVIARGYTTAQEVEVYEPMFSAYNRRGGNGVIDRLHEQVKLLPIKES